VEGRCDDPRRRGPRDLSQAFRERRATRVGTGPPLVDSLIVAGGQANTYDIYDLFGRQVFVALTARF
jgi:hypothetical protein